MDIYIYIGGSKFEKLKKTLVTRHYLIGTLYCLQKELAKTICNIIIGKIYVNTENGYWYLQNYPTILYEILT